MNATKPAARRSRIPRRPVETDLGFTWGMANSLLLGLGVATLVAGYVALARGSTTLAPVLLVRARHYRELIGAGRDGRPGLYLVDAGEGRSLLPQLANEGLDRRAGSLNLALNFPGCISYPPGQPMAKCQPVDEGPEANALDDTRYVEANSDAIRSEDGRYFAEIAVARTCPRRKWYH